MPAAALLPRSSPAGDGVTSDQTAFRKILMDTMFKDGVRELGRAFQIAKQTTPSIRMASILMNSTVHRTVWTHGDEMNLFGDPAMRLPVSGRVPQAPVVSIVRTGSAGSQVKLSWPAVTKDTLGADTTVTKYDIWRGTRPYFDPTVANCNCTRLAETTSLNWVDDGSNGPIAPIGDVANNYFYVVRAQNSSGWSLSPNRKGEFDFALTPGVQ